MMRVLELLGPSTGGIRRHVAQLAKLLAEGDTAIPIIAGPVGVMDGLDTGSAEILSASVPASFHPKAIVAGIRSVRSLAPEVDVIHAHGLKAAWTAVLARTGKPVVLTIHNVVLDDVAGRGAAVQRQLERMITRRVDAVIAASPEIVERFGVGTFILPVSEPPAPSEAPAEVRARHGVDPDSTLVVSVGRLHPQKDVPTLLRAWSRVEAAASDALCLVVGDGPARRELEAEAQRLGLQRLRFVGASPYAVNELAAADVVVQSSVWEAVPLTIAEAVQLAKPIVSTRVGVVETMAGEGAIVVDVGDDGALSEGLLAMITDPQRRAAASATCAERAAGLYRMETLVDDVVSIYRGVVRR